ncbi:hypothetical protein ACVIDN_004217 [Rhizobium brockwellii]
MGALWLAADPRSALTPRPWSQSLGRCLADALYIKAVGLRIYR